MLLGHYPSKLTEKGRTALPVKFRKKLGKKIIVARWYENCLVVVSEESWKALLERLTGKAEYITQPVRDTDRFILGSAFEISLDGQGRFVLPKHLREYAKLKDDLIFMGLGTRVEIWDKRVWEERETFIQEHAEDLIEKLANEERKTVRKT